MGEDDLLMYLVIVALIMGFIGTYVSNQKNRSGWEGFLFGFFLSILGVIIVAILPTKEKEKPAELSELTDEKKKYLEKGRKSRNIFYVVLLLMLLIIALTKALG